MLVLSRRINETVHIGDNITLRVISIQGSHVRIGIAAPREVAVDREEVWQRKRQERIANADPVPATPEVS